MAGREGHNIMTDRWLKKAEQMKKIFLVLFFMTLSTASSGHADTITLRADIWCPYNCDPNSDSPGFMIEIARQVFESAGHSVDYELLNWARAVDETRVGKHNAIIGAYKSEVPDFIFPENALGQAVDMFYTIEGSSWYFENTASIKGSVIGIIKGYSYGDELDEYIGKNKKQFAILHGDDAFERNLEMLYLGRVNALIENQFVMNNYLKNNKSRKPIIEAGMVNRENVYIAFSPKNPNSKTYARILSDGINTLRASGELKIILAKYGLSDWQ
jgi:polar amino acid transport system substrate-binding protein